MRGPKTEEGKARAREALIENRPAAPNYKHGKMSFLKLGTHPCDRCVFKTKCKMYKKGGQCAYILEYQRNVEEFVMGIDGITEKQRGYVEQLVKVLGAMVVCEMYFSVAGMVLYDKRKNLLSAQPLLKDYDRLQAKAIMLMNELKLGLASREKLELEKAKVVKPLDVSPSGSEEGTEFLDD